MWEGIDGTEIFTYFLTAQDKIRGQKPQTATTYSALLNPQPAARGAYERYQQKELNGEVLVPFGLGDGGGGPTVRDLEYHRILKRGNPRRSQGQDGFAGSMLTRLRERALHNPEKHPIGRGALPGISPRHLYLHGAEQAIQPEERAAVSKSRNGCGNERRPDQRELSRTNAAPWLGNHPAQSVP